jgi:hypothetical protein
MLALGSKPGGPFENVPEARTDWLSAFACGCLQPGSRERVEVPAHDEGLFVQIEPGGPNELGGGPDRHGGSNWVHPGSEWGTGWFFWEKGCWRIHATRGKTHGDVFLLLR